MKHLKSTISDLRKLFESSITVKDIAEPFASFDANSNVSIVKDFMDIKDYDIIGVRKNGLVHSYAVKNEFYGKTLEENIKGFEEEDLLDESAPIKEVFEKLEHRHYLFVLVIGHIGGIVTRGDLQKIPVRMWLFGVVSLIEMQLLRIIKDYYPNDEWISYINDTRLIIAKEMCEQRRKDDIDIGLADCLQFKDKYNIIKKDNTLWEKLSLGISKNECNNLFEELRKLRDNLAHVQNIITEKFEEVVANVRKAEQVLQILEQFSVQRDE